MTQTGTWVGVGAQRSGQLLPQAPSMPEEQFMELLSQEAQWSAESAHGGSTAPDWELMCEVEEALAAGAQHGDGPAPGMPGWAAQELSWGLEAAERGLDRAASAGQELVGVFDEGLSAGLEQIGHLRCQMSGIAYALAAEAHRRGLHSAVGLTLISWLQVRAPWLSRAEASQIQDVVRAGETHWGAGLAEAVTAGETGLHRAAQVARTLRRLAPGLEPDQREAYAEIVTDAIKDPDISDTDVRRVCQKLLVDVLDEKPRDEAKQTAHQLRCVSRRPLGQGMTRFTIDAPEADAALFDGVLTGPLSAPTPASDGELDMRSAGQRRYDAVLAVLNRGLSNPGAPPSSGRASIMLTVTADPDTGVPTGAAFANTGQVLDAGQAGRYACLGDVTPIVLGEYGEPLRLGRTVRLATPGQFKALMVRDRQCTYPGCDVPGTWCDAHHLVWFCRGGGTDIELLVLLCPRHHTLVHDKDLMATVRGSVVTWHV